MSTTEENRNKIRPLVEALARVMSRTSDPVGAGGTWRVEQRGDSNGLTLTDGEVALFVRTSYTTNNLRLHVTASYPTGTWRNNLDLTVGEVTVALTRDPKAAAKHLVKFIEIVRSNTKIATGQINKDAEALAARQAFLASLVPLGAKGPRTGGSYARDDEQANDARIWITKGDTTMYGDVRISYDGGGGDLHLRSLSADTILAILTLVSGQS